MVRVLRLAGAICLFGVALSFVGGSGAQAAPRGTPRSAGTTPFTGASFVSEPGDYIGEGLSYPAMSVAYEGLSQGYPEFNLSDSTIVFQALLSPPAGQPLVPGTYLDAQRSRSADFPGLDVTGGGRGCDQVVGSFTVYDATYDTSGNLVSFAAQFFQHCEGFYAALMGNISFNSDVALPPLPATAPEPPQEAQLVSQPGDYLGQGATGTFPIAYPFGGSNNQGPQRWLLATDSASPYWDVVFDTAQPPALGSYLANDCSVGSAKPECLMVSGSGRSCSSGSASYTIYDIGYDSLGMLKSFAAEFIYPCVAGGPALYGAIRWNSTVAMPARFVSADTATATVGTPFSFTVRTSGLPVPSLKRSHRLPQGLRFFDNGDGTATISGTPVAGTNATYRLPIRAITKSGTTRLEAEQVLTLVVAS